MSRQAMPIRPGDVSERQNNSIPDVVIEVFNELIIKDYSNGSATVFQEDVVKALVKKGLDKGDIYGKRWLDVEGIFRKQGWKVDYDKPGYNESYRPYFVFKSKKSD